MAVHWRERLKKMKFAYWVIVAGLVFFAVVIALGMAEIISTQQILLLGQGYALLLLVATLIQMIVRRL
jgi:uncharacterized membrane protein